MNRNRHIQTAAVALSAGVLISTVAAGPVISASPLAGVVASMANVASSNASEVVIEETSTLSGTNLMLKNMIDQVQSGKIEAAEVAEEAAEVAAEVAEAPAEVPEYANVGFANVSDYVNIRTAPDANAPLAGKLVANGGANVLGTEGEWTHIQSGNVDGYVRSDLLTVGDETLYYAHSRLYATVKADGLNVRQDASTEAGRLSTAKNGSVLYITDELEENAEWVKVETLKGEGYVNTEFVDVDRRFNAVAVSREEEQAKIAAEQAAKRAAEEAKKAKSSSSSSKSKASATQRQQAPARSYSAPSGGSGSNIVNYALQFVGNPYRYGGTSLTNGTDCSGFVMRVYGDCGVSGLPHSSSGLRNVGYGVSVDEMQPGDIVCYSGHVGIYAGNGNIVHASTRSTGIKVSSAYYRNIVAVRRIF